MPTLVVTRVEAIQEAVESKAVQRFDIGELSEAKLERLDQPHLEQDEALIRFERDHDVEQSVQALTRGPDDIVDEVVDEPADPPRASGRGGDRMKALYIYAITPAIDHWAGTGVNDAKVYALREGNLSALVHSAESDLPVAGSDDRIRDALLAHVAVVEKAWEELGTVIPVHFNVLVRSSDDESAEDKLRTWLRDQATLLERRLEALRGRVELRVDLSIDLEAAPRDDEVRSLRAEIESPSPQGRRLLQRKLQHAQRNAAQRKADALYPYVRRRLAALAEDVDEQRRSRPGSDDVPVFTASLLVPAIGIETVGATLSALQVEEPALRIRLLGPWPPYSFGIGTESVPLPSPWPAAHPGFAQGDDAMDPARHAD